MTVNTIRTFIIILLFSAGSFVAKAQDSIAPLNFNPVLDAYMHSAKNASNQPQKRSKNGEPVTQYLPFFDDFSTSSLYPNEDMWLDNDVYINNTFGNKPPSVGVATFDGIDASGKAYNPGDQSTGSIATDTLTSTYIDLSSFTDADSIYLSFYYQPQGFGDAPETGDSLMLQFHPDSLQINGNWDDSAWVQIWSVPGENLHPFRQVMIPIRKLTSPNYFHNKFQFRFVSKGHRSGNLDNWHVDYVYVNRGRQKAVVGNNDVDNDIQDVAVYKPSGSILQKYYAMTIKQFQAGGSSALATNIPVYARNNSNSSPTKNVTFGYFITDRETGDTIVSNIDSSGDNVNALNYKDFTLTNDLSPSDITGDKKNLLVNTIVQNTPDQFRHNDTATHVQRFDDYLAYDDGAAEAGYGLVGANIGKVAVRFTLNTPDTLYGIAIHFNQANNYVGGKYVNLGVWHSLTPVGQPEKDEPAERITYVKPVYDGINQYSYYEFEQPVAVSNEFYIGWLQNQDFYLNVGFDRNYQELQGPKSDNLFISTTGKWQKSEQNGIPMIRPYIGSKPVFVSTQEISKPNSAGLDVNIYPNPNNGNFNISLPKSGHYEILVFDIAGKPVMQMLSIQENTSLSLQGVKAGIYLVKIADQNTGNSVVKRISVL